MIGNICIMSNYLAYAMSTYCIASVYYLIRSRSVGTPFNDSLTQKQIQIKKQSAKVRKNLFFQGVALGILSLFLFRPFSQC
jgi:hypothetical protein